MRTGSDRSGRGVRRIARAGGAKHRGLGAPRSVRGGTRKPSAARSPRLEALTEELCDVAERQGIRVRQERLLREVGYHTQSGLVRLDGTEILLLDHELSPEARVDLLVGVLAGRDLGGLELSDDARRALAPAERGSSIQAPRAEEAGAAPAHEGGPGAG